MVLNPWLISISGLAPLEGSFLKYQGLSLGKNAKTQPSWVVLAGNLSTLLGSNSKKYLNPPSGYFLNPHEEQFLTPPGEHFGPSC